MKYKIKSGLVWEKIGSKLIILDPQKGRHYSLNRTAGEIWLCMQKPLSQQEIIELFCKKYQSIKREELDLEIKECLTNLVKNGVARLVK